MLLELGGVTIEVKTPGEIARFKSLGYAEVKEPVEIPVSKLEPEKVPVKKVVKK